jgi:hypothetical protein
VFFRDFVNFSRDSINLILKPAWKLLNRHLPVFTEVLAYNCPLPKAEDDYDDSDDQYVNPGDDSFDEEEKYGVEGMTFYLLELLSTLVMRPNVQQLVMQGLVPLMTTVCSYLLIEHRHERYYFGDLTYFIADRGQELHKIDTIRSQCLVLISSLIEVFGDVATHGLTIIIEKLFKTQDQSKEIKDEESKDQPLDEEMDEESESTREAEEFKAMLQELTYVSSHHKNEWKRRETAILLSSVFIEDISMFMIRNPKYDVQTLIFDELLKTANCKSAPKVLQGLLVGRAIQCALLSSELVRMHEERGVQYSEKVLGFTIAAFECFGQFRSV